jgi:hypothetical protein
MRRPFLKLKVESSNLNEFIVLMTGYTDLGTVWVGTLVCVV